MRLNDSTSGSTLGFGEFVTLMALLMALSALAIASVLPALTQIGAALHLVSDNQRQWVVTAYLLGFGCAQLFYGALSDRFGRKSLLLLGLCGYIVCGVIAACSTSLEMMVGARFLQGVGGAAARVLTISIIRDRYAGTAMARVLSLAFGVFLVVPVVAPWFGDAVLLVASWQWIFAIPALAATILAIWVAVRLPETLRREDRRSLSVSALTSSHRAVLTNLEAMSYMTAMAAINGAILAFINSVQQILSEVFGAPERLPAVFAIIGLALAVASLLNSKLVQRCGARRVASVALFSSVPLALLHLAIAWAGRETLWIFVSLQTATMFCLGSMMANFAALSLEPLGRLAGTASSVQGCITLLGGALLGFVIGQRFDGTVLPLLSGTVACVITTLVLLLSVHRRLLAPPQLDAAADRPAR